MRFRTLFVAAVAALALTAPAVARADLGFMGIGPTLSYVTPEDIDGTIGFGAIADFGTIVPNLGLEVTGDFWSKSEGEGNFEVKFQDISFGGRAMYHFPMENPQLDPAVGGGLALHLLRTEIPETVIAGITFGGDETETRIGFDLAGELGIRMTENTDVLVLAAYRVVEDFGQFVLGAGLMFKFGGPGGNTTGGY